MLSLEDLQRGKPQLLICDDYEAFRTWAESQALKKSPPLRLLEISGIVQGDIHAAISEAVRSAAEAALSIWPDWVSSQNKITERGGSVAQTEWERVAQCACKQGRAPVTPGMHPAAQIERLSGVLGLERLLYLVPLEPGGSTEAQLRGYASFVRWLGEKTSAAVLAICSEGMATHPSLDAIRYEARSWNFTEFAQPTGADVETPGEQEQRGPLFPFIGEPHPASPGEQALAKALQADPELGPLFGFNQPVIGGRGQAFTVDLLWSDGNFCVEVDGYRFHSGKTAFAQDRQRDFELMLGGFQVLRLTHDEVMGNVSASVEKIRALVQLRQPTVRNPH